MLITDEFGEGAWISSLRRNNYLCALLEPSVDLCTSHATFVPIVRCAYEKACRID